MNNILNQLKDHFNNTSKEVIEKEWFAFEKDFGDVGPKIEEFLIVLEEPEEWEFNIQDKDIVIKTAPNCYNSEFFLSLSE